MIYHIFKEAPKSWNSKIIKFLEDYNMFPRICTRHPHGEKLMGVPVLVIREPETARNQGNTHVCTAAAQQDHSATVHVNRKGL